VDEWEAYEQRRREREQLRLLRRRRAARRRRLTVAVAAVLALGAAGYVVAGQLGAAAPSSAAAGRSRSGGSATTLPPTASTAASRPATTNDPAPPRGRVTLAAVGDTMLGSTPTLPPDPAGYFAGVRSQLVGGIVFGNLEGTLTDRTDSKCRQASSSCYAFRAPPSFARDLREAGFTILSNANNHSFDYWQPGQEDTVAALHRAGIAQTGLPDEVTVLHVRRLRVAFVGFAPYSDTAPLNDFTAAAALIRRADKAADVVVVAIHAGAEGTDALHLTGATETYVGENRGNPEAFARMAVDNGADLVLGSGPHVLRGMELYRHRLIAYSLGNFAGYHNFSLDGDLAVSAILHVTLNADGSFRSGRVISVRLVGAGQPEIDPSGAGARLIAQLSASDLGARAVRLTPSGRIRIPA
jgi:Bacterial capsule synthesis protein PGA_cap